MTSTQSIKAFTEALLPFLSYSLFVQEEASEPEIGAQVWQ
jgi:hypothetical protein